MQRKEYVDRWTAPLREEYINPDICPHLFSEWEKELWREWQEVQGQ